MIFIDLESKAGSPGTIFPRQGCTCVRPEISGRMSGLLVLEGRTQFPMRRKT